MRIDVPLLVTTYYLNQHVFQRWCEHHRYAIRLLSQEKPRWHQWCHQNGIGIPLYGILESSRRHLYLPTAETTSWRQDVQMPVPAGTAVKRKYTFHEEVKFWACLSDADRFESSPSPYLIDSGSVFYALRRFKQYVVGMG